MQGTQRKCARARARGHVQVKELKEAHAQAKQETACTQKTKHVSVITETLRLPHCFLQELNMMAMVNPRKRSQLPQARTHACMHCAMHAASSAETEMLLVFKCLRVISRMLPVQDSARSAASLRMSWPRLWQRLLLAGEKAHVLVTFLSHKNCRRHSQDLNNSKAYDLNSRPSSAATGPSPTPGR